MTCIWSRAVDGTESLFFGFRGGLSVLSGAQGRVDTLSIEKPGILSKGEHLDRRRELVTKKPPRGVVVAGSVQRYVASGFNWTPFTHRQVVDGAVDQGAEGSRLTIGEH